MTIDEIFAALPDEVAQDVNEYLVIDPATRTIKVPESESIFGTEADADSERKYFISPRYVGDNLDLAACFLSIVYRNANGETDQYLITDTAVNGEYVTFSWLLAEKVVKYKGPVQFRFDADTAAGPAWGTTMAQGESLEGLEPEIDASTVEEQTSDVVTQLRAMVTQQTGNVEAVGAAQVAAVKAQGTASTQEAVAVIQAQGAATNASIPADYTELEATVDRLTRDRAAAIVCQEEGAAIQVQDASNDPLQGLRIFGRSTQDGTPTPDNPVEIVSTPAPVVTVCGVNLWDEETELGYWQSANGEAYTADNQLRSKNFIPIIPNATIYATAPNNKVIDFVFYDRNKTFLHSKSIAQEITSPANAHYMHINLRADYGTTYNNDVCISLAALNGIYIPNTGGQALTITTPGSLPGIPVASGGNYTDENGQQWICDEVDLARGVYVQRVGRLTLDGSAKWNAYNYETTYYGFHIWDLLDEYHSRSPGMCNQFEIVGGSSGDCIWVGASNANVYAISKEWYDKGLDAWKEHLNAKPLAIVYARVTPIETPLTDVELQAFLALHSNKPTTTVLNDAGAHMVLEYAADPKTYIDHKLAALVAANN